MLKQINYKQEYPRPDFERKDWLNLNGEWNFSFDDENRGEAEQWYIRKNFDRKIVVPFCFQSKMSGIYEKGLHESVWYQRTFYVPHNMSGKRILLHFGAVDYIAKIWINGVYVGHHRGGHVSFQFDITSFLTQKKNTLVVKAEDSYNCSQPRGKQYWKESPDRCWYTATSGIWQSVWIEAVGTQYIQRLKLIPDIDKKEVRGEIYLNQWLSGTSLLVHLFYQGKQLHNICCEITDNVLYVNLHIKEEDFIDEIHYWSPEQPNLYDIEFILLKDNRVEDAVKSYFGMRKISVKGDCILLNNRPYYQQLVLDQGYWPESLMTPPSDDAIKADIELTKQLGFNGVRKHQKVEDPRYYYWADKLGLLVWAEFPSAYQFHDIAIENCITEWLEVISRDYNHPCIITWVPLNESWGIRNIVEDPAQQNFARTMYYLTKAIDSTRLISTNDGWEQINDTDLCGIHDYAPYGSDFIPRYCDKKMLLQKDAQGRLLYCNHHEYQGQPIIISEFGGISFVSDNMQDWGYSGLVKDQEEFLHRFRSLVHAIRSLEYVSGYCYTQLTDVMQETNGLLTADRSPKVYISEIAAIQDITIHKAL